MGKRFVAVAVLVWWVGLLTFTNASECNRVGDCSCEFYDGRGINLRPIIDLGGQPLHANDSSGDAYYFSPCQDINYTADDSKPNMTSNECFKGYTLCKYDAAQNQLVRLGELKETQFTSNDGLFLSYIKPNHSKPSTGTVLLIMLFVGFVSYFLIGATVNALYLGARGIEMVPHLDFWRGLPGLVRDGAQFLQNGCRVANRAPDPDSYDAI
uniref:Autophagy-related protein 27 n=1 Tax=Anopheles melas TaxID=34690 RepID=A0A182UIJ7_9DIPT